MTGSESSKPSIKKRIADEFVEYVVIAAYFCVCFSAILFLKASVLKEQGIAFEPFGFAAIRALILAKFASIGHALHVGERFKNKPLVWPTLYRSIAFLVLLLALSAAEKVVEEDCGLVGGNGRRQQRRTHRHAHRDISDTGPLLRVSRAWGSGRRTQSHPRIFPSARQDCRQPPPS